MLYSPSFANHAFVFRLALLLALVFLTFKYTRRGMQNGILIGLITGMSPVAILLFRTSELLPGLPMISLDRIVWPTVLAAFFFKRSRGETARLPLDGIERGLLAFVAVMLASMLIHGSYTGSDGEWDLFSIMRGYGFPFVAYFVARREARAAKQLQPFLVGLGFIALYFVLTGMAQLLGLHQLVFPQFILDPELGVHSGRPRALFLNASAYGLAIATSLPLLIWLYFTDRAPRRYLWPLVAVLSVVPLLYTLQRAAWLSAIVALAVTVLAWPKRRVILTGVFVFCAGWGLVSASDAVIRQLEARLEEQATIDFRFEHIEAGWALFRENPVLGVGINRFGLEAAKHFFSGSALLGNAHNTWITLLAELGLIGFFTFLMPFTLALFKSVQLYWRLPKNRAILGILVGITLSYFAMSISIEMRGNLYANSLLFTLWTMILGSVRRVSDVRQRRPAGYRRRMIVRSGLTALNRPELRARFSEAPRTTVGWSWASQRRRQSRRVQGFRD
jgi:putative inorganic carbon (HCO3(-)) transporter